MAYEFKVNRQVEFADTDMAGIMHFSNFFRFMEVAEQAFFRSLGFSVYTKESEKILAWPRVHAECDYQYPLRFEDLVEIHLLVRSKKEKSLSYEFIFRLLNSETTPEVARGAIKVVCATFDSSIGRLKSIPIPDAIALMIDVAP